MVSITLLVDLGLTQNVTGWELAIFFRSSSFATMVRPA